MADQDKQREFDELLDSMLSQYSAVEPRPGLETRIMARIADSRSAGSRLGVLRWLSIGAAAVALAAIVAATFFLHPAMRLQEFPNSVQTKPQPISHPPIAGVSHDRGRSRQVRITHRTVRQPGAIEVRQEVFPTPAPISEQEILLLRYLSRTPRQELVAQSHPDPLPDEGAAEGGSALFPGLSNQRFSNQ